MPTPRVPSAAVEPTLSATQLGLRALLLGGMAVVFVTAMLAPAVPGVSDLPSHVLGKLQGEDPKLQPPDPVKLTPLQQARFRASAVRLATAEFGVKEWPSRDNRGDRIVTYRRAVTGANENPRAPEPWCADFVSWAWRKAGHPIGFGGRGADYVGEIAAWGRLKGRYKHARAGYRPQPGDLVIYRGYSHVGMVVKVRRGWMFTIEGNYRDRVDRRKLRPWNGAIIGYVQPV